MWTLLGVIAVAGFVVHLLAWLTSSDPVFRRQQAPFTASTLFFVVFWVISLTAPDGGVLVDVIRGLAFLVSLVLLVVWWRRSAETKLQR
jgi:hypothetical protein